MASHWLTPLLANEEVDLLAKCEVNQASIVSWIFFFFYANLLPLKLRDHNYDSFHPHLLSKLDSSDHISNYYTLLHPMDAFRYLA